MKYVQPTDLIPPLKKAWRSYRTLMQPKPRIPSDKVLRECLSVAFQASFKTEEHRRTVFRLALLPSTYQSPNQFLSRNISQTTVVPFKTPRPLSVGELLRLAPATDPTKVLIAVEPNPKNPSGQLSIWGLVDTGGSWWDFARGDSDIGYPPPTAVTIASFEPASLLVSTEGVLLIGLRDGQFVEPLSDVLDRGPIGSFFLNGARSLREEVRQEVGDKKTSLANERGDNYSRRFYLDLVSRLIQRIAEMGHGGVVIFVRDEMSLDDTRLTDRLLVKYQCSHNAAWSAAKESLVMSQRHREHSMKIKRGAIKQDDFRREGILNGILDEANEAVEESVGFITALSGVDGAIVMTDRLRVLGFGAEVVASSPSLRDVWFASSADGSKGRVVSIDAFGTRHRSAFRFASSFDDAAVFVVSQDGGAKAVKRVGSSVVVWSDIQMRRFGLF
ncbi:putative sensor domain DACNV-containing protein [Cystobacter fuscus]|uniref:putative sensor domain DACNV-containing protein n=1 Tax=Cystobacter fuscus TaxID=43 RepID=UPI002B2AEE33|nr:hypothetical protein F0U63_40530 [Cystobacter fuscus]